MRCIASALFGGNEVVTPIYSAELSKSEAVLCTAPVAGRPGLEPGFSESESEVLSVGRPPKTLVGPQGIEPCPLG